MTTQEISLSQITPSVHQQIKAVQGDTGRQLRMNITDRYFSSATAGLYFERSDHTNYSVSCALINGSFEADITQALTQPGVTKCQLKVTESNKVVSTYTFQILVEKNVTGTATEQENYTIEEALSKAEQAVTTADEAVETANNLVSDLQDDIEEAQGYIDSFENLQETLDNKADVNGTYPSLTAGLAEQLLSNNRVTDQTPYLYRQTALGKTNATRALMKKIVGGSVVWNQLVTFAVVEILNKGITYTQRDDGSVLVNGTATDSSYFNIGTIIHGINDHVVLLHGCPDRGEHTFYGRDGYTYGKYDIGQGLILKKVSDNLIYQIVVPSGETVNNVVFKPQIHDLTSMFGTTIADYIYNLETASAGSGIAKLREWGFFGEDYYEYDPGTMKSVEGVSAKETVGFNQWDGAKFSGYINDVDNVSQSTNYYYTDYVRVFPNTEYHFHGTGGSNQSVVWYDRSKAFIEGTKNNAATERTITSPSNARYVRVSFPIENVDTFCINLSDPQRNGEYEPYSKHTYPLDSTKEWRGIFKLDENNNLYADGDIYPPSGEASRRYGIVDLGTLNWEIRPNRATATVPNIKIPSSVHVLVNIITENNYAQKSASTTLSEAGQFAVINQSNNILFYYDGTLPSGYMVYELATPTTETAEPYTEVQVVDKDGTEQFVTSGIVPVGHVTEYPEDLVGKLESIPSLPTTDGIYQLQATVNSGVVTYTWVTA